jgi:hypothetical protein
MRDILGNYLQEEQYIGSVSIMLLCSENNTYADF